MPVQTAVEVTREPRRYPRELVHLAAERCRLDAASKLLPLADVAAEEGWFK
jgi:hypothetical protein